MGRYDKHTPVIQLDEITTAEENLLAALVAAGFTASNFGLKTATFVLFESDTSVSIGDGRAGFAVPAAFNGLVLTAALATVHTKGVTGTTDIQIRRRRAGSDVDMLSTKITVGDEFFVADGVVNTSNDDLATGDRIYVDVDAVHSATAALGLTVVLTFNNP